jgi:hypothetical protein
LSSLILVYTRGAGAGVGADAFRKLMLAVRQLPLPGALRAALSHWCLCSFKAALISDMRLVLYACPNVRAATEPIKVHGPDCYA